MDVKASLMEAISRLQSAAPRGGEVWLGYEDLKKQVEVQDDPKVLTEMAQILGTVIKEQMNSAHALFKEEAFDKVTPSPEKSDQRDEGYFTRPEGPRRRRE